MTTVIKIERFIDHLAYYLGPIAVVFVAAYVVTYRHTFASVEAHRHVWMVWVACIGLAVLFVRLVRILLSGHRSAGQRRFEDIHAKVITLFYVLGVSLGFVTRLLHNGLQLGNFFIGAAALIGGLIVGFVFEAGQHASRDRTPRYREVSLAYLLIGALCAVFGLAPSTSVIEQGYFLSICGSLAASSYVVFRSAITSEIANAAGADGGSR